MTININSIIDATIIFRILKYYIKRNESTIRFPTIHIYYYMGVAHP
jgi:hypothetical protein